jgi:hypothetical protein
MSRPKVDYFHYVPEPLRNEPDTLEHPGKILGPLELAHSSGLPE